jgi:serine/threonine protein kinase
MDNFTQKTAAIKKIKNVMNDEYEALRVLRELRILRHLGGRENTLKIVDAYSFPPDTLKFDEIYLVTDYITWKQILTRC